MRYEPLRILRARAKAWDEDAARLKARGGSQFCAARARQIARDIRAEIKRRMDKGDKT
jgi:hypothetical protein